MVGDDSIKRKRLVRYADNLNDEQIIRGVEQAFADYNKREFARNNVKAEEGSLYLTRRRIE